MTVFLLQDQLTQLYRNLCKKHPTLDSVYIYFPFEILNVFGKKEPCTFIFSSASQVIQAVMYNLQMWWQIQLHF